MKKIYIYALFFTVILNVLGQSEKPLAVIVCSYNNVKYVEKNLASIFSQNYSNFRVIYVDDCSADGTAAKVEEYVKKNNLSHKLTLIKNNVRNRKIKNMYNAIHSCRDTEIVVSVDGDDWLAHQNVFSNLNKAYTNNDIWITYGQFVNYPSGKKGYSKHVPREIVEKKAFRKTWIFMPVRSFYAWLYKRIKLEDFIAEKVPGFEGKFYPNSDDLLMMWAMLEMAHRRFLFIPEVSYVRNEQNPLSWNHVAYEQKVKWPTNAELKSKKPYKTLTSPILSGSVHSGSARIDVLIFSNNFNDTQKKIKQFNRIANINQILVWYKGQNDSTSIEKLSRKYNAHFINDNQEIARDKIVSFLNKFPSKYVFLTEDTSSVNLENLNLISLVKILDQTSAYCFVLNNQIKDAFFKNGKAAFPYQHIRNNVYCWKFTFNINAYEKNCTKGTVFRKKDIIKVINTGQSFESNLKKHINSKAVGLFFD